MRYLSLLLLSVLFIPIVQVAYAQNIIDQIGSAFSNLTSGMMGGNKTNQTSSTGSSGGSPNQTSSDIGSFQELQNLTGGNQELLANKTSVAGENSSLGQGMEKEQFVESENQSNALSSANSTQ